MRIGFYAPGWPASTARNGIVTYVHLMAEALTALGHDCVVFVHSLTEEEFQPNVVKIDDAQITLLDRAVERLRQAAGRGALNYRMRGGLALARTVKKAHRAKPFDIFEIEESAGVGSILQRTLKIPVVTRLHGPCFLDESRVRSTESKARIAAEARWVRVAAGVTSPSRGVLKEMLQASSVDRADTRFIPNPIPLEEPRWSIDLCEQNLLLFVGRFDLRKGADIALRAFSLIEQAHPQMRLAMVGADAGLPAPDGRVLKFEEYMAETYPPALREKVTYYGEVSRGEADDLRRRCLAHISTSRFECFAYAITESLAVGCPVVASRTFGAAEELAHGSEILLADVEDAAGVAAQTRRLIEDFNLAQKIGDGGRAACRRLLAPETVARTTLDYYQSVIES